MKIIFRFDTLLFSLLTALNVLLFLGIFMNSPFRSEYSDKHHYLINRGLPIPWAGVSAIDKQVELPLIKAPFLVRKVDFGETSVFKIIDLQLFTLYVGILTFCFYPFFYVLQKFTSTNKYINKLMKIFYFVLIGGLLFLYFEWFPRI